MPCFRYRNNVCFLAFGDILPIRSQMAQIKIYNIHMQRCRKHFESDGVFQHFSYFLPIPESGGVTKSRPNDPFLCDIFIFEYKVWTKKCSNFILFAVNSTFFILYFT